MSGDGDSFLDAQHSVVRAHEIASAPVASALALLKLVWSDPDLPQELRARAQEAALCMAESAVQLEYLREAFELAGFGHQGNGDSDPGARLSG